jgi:acyl-CoA reductase-like NAD-dependent aldehyde dehydrogenase
MGKDTANAPEARPRLTSADMVEVSPLVEGRQIPSESTELFTTHNPASGEPLSRFGVGCAADVDEAVSAARRTYSSGVWRHTPPSAKKKTLLRWADLIERQAVRLDALDALEMGKPVGVQAFNARLAAEFVRFNAELADKIQGETFTSDSSSTVIQRRIPRGVVAAIVPWNFPTFNAVLKAAPALAAGNSVILKPSELASQATLVLANLALEAGLPPGVLNVVPGCGDIVGRMLAEHMDVDMVTFTGSSAVGKLVVQYAGHSNMKVVSAECGGKSPHIVFDDGLDLDVVASHIAHAIVLNQGQVCSVGSRLLVERSVERPLLERIIPHLARVVAGDPQLPTTTYGPLASQGQMERVLSFISAGRADGAELVHGGLRILEESAGYFVQPTVYAKVPERSRLAQEEVFGPVLVVSGFQDTDDAIRLANSTCYGLSAYVWTSRAETGFRVANEVHAGYTLVNAIAPRGEGPGMAISGEPYGLSGMGVEGGKAGVENYMRRHTVWFNHG